MSKLSYEDKIKIYQERKSGTSVTSIAKKYNINVHNIKYLIRLVDNHGLDILKTVKNKEYTKHEKEEAIEKFQYLCQPDIRIDSTNKRTFY